MDHISKITSQVSQNGSKPIGSEQSSNLISNLIFLFENLGYMFGHTFTSTHGESPVDEDGQLTGSGRTWAASLNDVTREQIVNGMRACKDSGDKWPPSIPEFVAMCKGKAINEFGIDYVPEYHREAIRNPERLLSSDKRDAHRKEVAATGMADIRAAMKRKEK